MRAKRLRDFDLGAFEDADELQPLTTALPLEMIVVTTNVSARVLETLRTATQGASSSRGVKIVVAFVRGMARRPGTSVS